MLSPVRQPWRRATVWAGVCIAAWMATLLVVGRSLNFLGSDEWDFITGSMRFTPGWLLESHNGHWSTLPKLVYALLLHAVGLRFYWPYLLVLAVINAAAAALLFILVRRRAGGRVALGAMVLLLVFGNGADGIISTFQVGFQGSVALGLAALALLDRADAGRGRVTLASAALLASVMCSGIGVVFCMAAGIEWLLDAARRRYVAALVVPALAFLAWFAGYGASGPGVAPAHPATASGLASVLNAVAYVGVGIASSVAALFGLPHQVASLGLDGLALAGLVAMGAWAYRLGGRFDPRVWGAAGGLVAQFAVTAVARQQLGIEQVRSGRYLAVAAVFGILLAAEFAVVLGRRAPLRRALVAVLLVSVIANAALLVAVLIDHQHKVETEAAELQTVAALRGSPMLRANAPIDVATFGTLTSNGYYAAVDRWGFPQFSRSATRMASLPPDVVQRLAEWLLLGAVTIKPVSPDVAASGTCAQTSIPAGKRVDVDMAQGQRPVLESAGSVDVKVVIWLASAKASTLKVYVYGNQTYALLLGFPTIADGSLWHLQFSSPQASQVLVCRAAAG